MEDWISIGLSVLALIISGATAWLTFFQSGKLCMTQPTSVFFGPDGRFFESRRRKVYLRTLLYSTASRGKVIDSMYIRLERGETKQNFSIWVHGDQENDLTRGSGLFVPREGVALHHHFLLPPDGSDFAFLAGNYRLRVFAKLVNDPQPYQLYTLNLTVSERQAQQLKKEGTGLFFDWGPDEGTFYPHIEDRSDSLLF